MMIDSHLHTENSFDCRPGCSDGLILKARALGLGGFTVTDHWEIGTGRYPAFLRDIAASRRYTLAMKRQAPNLDIGWGVELGQPHHDPAEAGAALSTFSFDFVLASCHMVRGREDFCGISPEDRPEELLRQYFEEMAELSREADFDSLAHLTYPLRYLPGAGGGPVDLSAYREQIDAVFTALIKRGASLEVNTSGLRQSLGETLPGPALLARYYELGGRRITLGSDAHETAHMAAGFGQALEMLWELGFTQVLYYRERRPRRIPLGGLPCAATGVKI